MERWNRLCWLGIALLAAVSHAFAPFPRTTSPLLSSTTRPTIQIAFQLKDEEIRPSTSRLVKIIDRFDTLKSAGFVDCGPSSRRPLMMRGPGFKRIAFWLFVGFMYKWYRARYINKIPVWDRQPQWNMVVTNREQEKELKAYTCKTCGSTLFIARNRDWFFEGDTGLGGLGCYSCGAKGKDNFVMDRDRILEDVGDDDDYFDYERPLDFVTAAERRALLKQAGGDEEAANQILVDQEAAAAKADAPEGAVDAVIEKTAEETKKEDEAAMNDAKESGGVGGTKASLDTTGDASSSTGETKPKRKKKKKKKKKAPTVDSTSDSRSELSASGNTKDVVLPSSSTKKPKEKKKVPKPKSTEPEEPPKKADNDDDVWGDLDALGI
eukprot:CAMPEP_0202494496 /NCGR_PEP_ID=MMETSP1361-20130828/12004_1 /ASSEMBLY_ACC=CAM_ASM_000849 /TAXON_ID=210615 /ORGANISM="Staurosira complex sp., Strain CCMP2646" /LENGTH=379 /DNA_ID=CAMNT_0049125049 /DNA_START=76 /DNA_END=1215 /DNA_ORIENTATION=+